MRKLPKDWEILIEEMERGEIRRREFKRAFKRYRREQRKLRFLGIFWTLWGGPHAPERIDSIKDRLDLLKAEMNKQIAKAMDEHNRAKERVDGLSLSLFDSQGRRKLD